MLFGVPQYIDVEDKIDGPFTGKQLLWMFGMGAVLLILWSMLERAAFFLSAVPVVLIFLALAFYRPYNQPLIKFVFSGFSFLLRPKIYSWQRAPQIKHEKEQKRPSGQSLLGKKEKKATLGEIRELAKVLDTGGRERSEKALEVIKEHTMQKNQIEKKEHKLPTWQKHEKIEERAENQEPIKTMEKNELEAEEEPAQSAEKNEPMDFLTKSEPVEKKEIKIGSGLIHPEKTKETEGKITFFN